jgi:spoIIIJ-associated protein
MTTSIETTGATVDEAIERALEDLEEARENVEVEVLEEAPQARVRVTLRETYAGNARLAVMALLSKMGIVAQVYVRKVEDPVTIDIAGQDLGVLIGWRGETLRSFQAVVNLIVNEGRSDRRRVIVDVERYRLRREETVREMALRLAQRARRSGERVLMDPMPAYERRIVHVTLDAEPGIRTESQGEEPNRRVVIWPEGASTAPRRPSEVPPAAAPEATPRRSFADRPRYGDRAPSGERVRFGEPRPASEPPPADEP